MIIKIQHVKMNDAAKGRSLMQQNKGRAHVTEESGIQRAKSLTWIF